MDFEKQLRDELHRLADQIQPPDQLKARVVTSFEGSRKETRGHTIKKRLITAIMAVAILVPTGVFAGPKLPSLVEKIVGSPEKASEKLGVSKEGYENFNQTLEVAKQILTDEEYEHLTALLKEQYQFWGKISVVENGERRSDYKKYESLTAEEKKRFSEIMRELDVYNEKIYGKFTYKIEETQKIVGYPIKLPTYIPNGYVLEETTIKANPTVGTPKPVIEFRYKNSYTEGNITYENEFSIVQSDISGPGSESFVVPSAFNNKEIKFDKLTGYNLDGYSISYGEYSHGATGMKIIVPAKASNNAYQIYIGYSNLSKEELEKILLSMVK